MTRHACFIRFSVAFACLVTATACGGKSRERVDDPGAQVRVEVQPSEAVLTVGSQKQFSAIVIRTDKRDVTWSVAERDGGSIDETGFYTAPARDGRFTVVASSTSHPSAHGVATVVVGSGAGGAGGHGGSGGEGGTGGAGGAGGSGPAITIAVDPAFAQVITGGRQRFDAVVQNADDPVVTWSVEEGDEGGTIDAQGNYRAPSQPGNFRINAASRMDPSKIATSHITVVEPSSTDASGLLPADRRTTWRPGLDAVGGIPADDDPERPATIHLPAGDPYDGFSVNPALGNGSTDARDAIQNVLRDAGRNASETDRRIVLLPPGEFSLTGHGLNVPAHVTLRGQGSRGPNATRLIKRQGSGMSVINMGHLWFNTTTPIDLAEDALHGATRIEVASNPGYQVGEMVFIDQLVDSERVGSWWNTQNQSNPSGGERAWFSRQNRPTGQVVEISAIEGNVLTLSTPIRLRYYTSNAAQVVRFAGGGSSNGPMVPTMRWSGVEDLYVAGGEGGDGGGNIHLFATAYSWVKNVESTQSIGTSVAFTSTFRCVLRDSFVHSTQDPNPGGAGYGIGLDRYAADNLIENNISWNFNKVLILRATGGGNVIGYNYFEDGWGSGYRSIPEVGLNAAHFATPHHELLEGNQAWNIAGDAFWGNSIDLTFYRNHVTGKRRSVTPLRLTDEVMRRFVEVPEWQLWSSYIGNVLGSNDMQEAPQSGFVYEDTAPWTHDPVPVWQIGKQHNAGQHGTDARVVATTIRHGNFDYVTRTIVWDDGIERQDMPPSLYLESKPAFFGSDPWPWVVPESNEQHLGRLPARERFDELMGL